MVDPQKQPKLVGALIRKQREALGLSQRALGQLFNPPVTTQFISNVERGVTPLPPAHVPTLTQALKISEDDLMALLEREYTLKLSGRLGRTNGANGHDPVAGDGALLVLHSDHEFMRNLYDAFKRADMKTREAFTTACESVLSLSKNLKTPLK